MAVVNVFFLRIGHIMTAYKMVSHVSMQEDCNVKDLQDLSNTWNMSGALTKSIIVRAASSLASPIL